jgi:hypothetical protein
MNNRIAGLLRDGCDLTLMQMRGLRMKTLLPLHGSNLNTGDSPLHPKK